MSTTSLSGTFTSVPDTPSPIFPERLIRPLPKRLLRDRLSQEAADSIFYPPAPQSSSPIFYSPYNENDSLNDAKVRVQQNLPDYVSDYTHDGHVYDDDLTSGEDEGPILANAEHLDGTPSRAPTNGPDGYDAFENTNNKKKRKIPTSGVLGSHHSSLSSDIASIGMTLNADETGSYFFEDTAAGQFYGSGTPATPVGNGNGISGAGRGRYGRHAPRTPKSPVTSSNGSSTWQAARMGAAHNGANGDSQPERGIISDAIAAHAAGKSPTAHSGQENQSLLEQKSKKSTPSNGQFTFSCESDVSKGVIWPQQPAHQPLHPASGNHNSPASRYSQGNQTSPRMSQPMPPNGHASESQPSQPRKPRRRPESVHALAARQRKLTQEYNNFHHPPKLEDIWICQFCEYESIFGRPPEALIRQYEIKDRKERRRLAEKRRLLEKAKMKGRKGKKQTKAAKAASAASQQNSQQTNWDDHGANGQLDQDDRSEAEYDDGYDDASGSTQHHHHSGHCDHDDPPSSHAVAARGPHDGTLKGEAGGGTAG